MYENNNKVYKTSEPTIKINKFSFRTDNDQEKYVFLPNWYIIMTILKI